MKIIQICAAGEELYALCDNGKVWKMYYLRDTEAYYWEEIDVKDIYGRD